jgi:DNA modification methylase
MRVSELNPHPNNPRKVTPDKLRQLSKTIKEFGSLDGIVFNKVRQELVSGHQRLKHAKDSTEVQITETLDKVDSQGTVARGYVEIEGSKFPYREVAWDDDAHSAAMLLANKNAGDWDLQRRADIMLDLDSKNKDLELTGHDEKEVQDTIAPLWPEDEEANEKADHIPEVAQNELNVKLGDLYQLGEHRLLCGDCTDKSNVDKLMDGEKADMVFTDPPYGMNLDTAMSGRQTEKDGWLSNPKNYSKVIGDGEDFHPGLITTVFDNFGYVAEVFLFGADYYAELIPDRKKGSWVSWDKRAGVETMKWSTSEFELCWSKQRHHRKVARITWSGILGTEQEHDHSSGRTHPTQKPTKLAEWFFDHWGKDKINIVDLYLGSGSTLIACEKTKRKCYGMEIDPHYCSVIIKRWQEFTGNTAQKING